MDTAVLPTLHKISAVCERTGFSRSTLYREIHSPENPQGRLKIVRVGRAVRVREQDLADFINALAF